TRKHKKEIHECKAFAADLQTAFSINTNTDNAQVYPEHFCHCCHHTMQRIISARVGVHHRCALTPFVWEAHTNEGCKVCEHFSINAKGHVRKHTVGRGRQPGLTPNMLIAHLWKIAPPPIFSSEPYP
ncbi:hypothetical protein EMCRGX_G028766, partial [Ephydatia muelleri]